MNTPGDISETGNVQASPPGRIRRVVSGLQGFVIGFVVDLLVLLVLMMLLWVVGSVAGDVWTAVTTRSGVAFKDLSVELLSVFIFIELFHSLTEYMRFHRIRVTNLVDASLAFVLREVWVSLYAGEASWQRVIALAVLVLSLGVIRTLAVVYSPSERAADLAEV